MWTLDSGLGLDLFQCVPSLTGTWGKWEQPITVSTDRGYKPVGATALFLSCHVYNKVFILLCSKGWNTGRGLLDSTIKKKWIQEFTLKYSD